MANNTLGTLLIELKAKTDQFEKGMKNAKDLSFTTTTEILGSLRQIGNQLLNMRFNGLEQAGKSMAILGGIAAGTGVALATSVIAVAVETSTKMVEMGHAAEKTGMGIKEFTENAYAAKRSGVPIEDFTNSMAKLAKTALSAAEGNSQAQRALKLAGTSATDANGHLRSTGDILGDVVKRFESLGSATLKAGLAQQVFGRGGATMLPFLEKGSAAIAEYKKQADLLGIALDENTLEAAKRFKGGINDFKAAAEGATFQLTAGMLPALNNIFDSMTKVTGKASAMHELGETIGSVFQKAAELVYRSAYAFDYWGIKLEQLRNSKPANIAKGVADALSGNPSTLGIAIGTKFDDKTDYDAQIRAADQKLQDRLSTLYGPSKTSPTKKEGGGVNSNLNPESQNIANAEIAKLRERAQATSALAAAQLLGGQSVRATTAANQADAIILQIATKAAKEHKTALDDEIVAAQKKYGATVLSLVTIADESQRNDSLNKSIKDQTREAGISADAHARMTAAIAQGGDAVTRASIANQIDALIRNADLKLTKDQIDALEKLRQAKQKDADATAREAYATEVKNLQNAANATRMLIDVQGAGIEAEFETRAAIQVDNYERQHNITLTKEQRKELLDLYAAQERRTNAQNTGAGLISEYDPQKTYERRIHEIDAAVKENRDLTVYAEAAKRDAYLQEQEALDAIAMKTQRGAAGATVALRQWLREAQNWAVQFHGAVTSVLQGFDSGFRTAFHDIIMGTKSVGQAFLQMGQTMVGSVVDALGQIVAKWIETKIILAVTKLFGIDLGEDPMAKAQKQIAANAAQAQSYAGLAAAEEFAFALAESMGDLPYAIGMSLVALGVGEGYTAMASFDNGGIMPKTGVALVHQDEGVLTAPVTKMLKNMATSPRYNSPTAGRGNQSRIGGDTHVTYAPSFTVFDSRDVKQVLDEHAGHIQGIVDSGNRNRGLEAIGV